MYCPNCQREIADFSNYCYFCGARQAGAAARAVPPRRLHRSSVDCKIAGVCGGIAEYFDIDSTIVRLLWVLVTFLSAMIPGIVVYIVAWLVMPEAVLAVPVQPVTQNNPAGSASAPQS